jgi:aminoglycoside/choline kinase family phosphotransferase
VVEVAIEKWLDSAIRGCWAGAHPAQIETIRGDASTRRFWRVRIDDPDGRAPFSAVAVDLGPDDLPAYVRALGLISDSLDEPPFVNVHRFLKSIGVAVPELYAFSAEARLVLVEDVGESALFDAAARATPHDAAALYRKAVDELVLIHCEGTRRLDRGCIAARVAYDERLFRWELDQFIDIGIPLVAPAAAVDRVTPELDQLAATLGELPRVLSHRDYHGHNLFVQNGTIRVIDFQDALLAPHAQDLAVLLTTRDTARAITPAMEERLLHYYLGGLSRRGLPTPREDEFMRSYRLCVLQHALKVIGRFASLERNGRSGYVRYIPWALANARRMLVHTEDFGALRQALDARVS